MEPDPPHPGATAYFQGRYERQGLMDFLQGYRDGLFALLSVRGAGLAAVCSSPAAGGAAPCSGGWSRRRPARPSRRSTPRPPGSLPSSGSTGRRSTRWRSTCGCPWTTWNPPT